jgi:hypothetical protein
MPPASEHVGLCSLAVAIVTATGMADKRWNAVISTGAITLVPHSGCGSLCLVGRKNSSARTGIQVRLGCLPYALAGVYLLEGVGK